MAVSESERVAKERADVLALIRQAMDILHRSRTLDQSYLDGLVEEARQSWREPMDTRW